MPYVIVCLMTMLATMDISPTGNIRNDAEDTARDELTVVVIIDCSFTCIPLTLMSPDDMSFIPGTVMMLATTASASVLDAANVAWRSVVMTSEGGEIVASTTTDPGDKLSVTCSSRTLGPAASAKAC